jgi:hypothetical protein
MYTKNGNFRKQDMKKVPREKSKQKNTDFSKYIDSYLPRVQQNEFSR